MLRIQLLGLPQVDCDGQPLTDLVKSPNLVRLFAFLVVHRHQRHSRGVLAGLFYPDQPESTARRNLNQLLYRLRTALQGCPCLLSTSQAVQFDPQADFWFDAAEFERCAQQQDAPSLERAVALYRAEFFEGCDDDWCVAQRERLREIYVTALRSLARIHEAEGHLEQALIAAQQWVRADVLNEDAHDRLITLLLAVNRVGDAREQFRRYESLWRTELNLPPSAHMRQLAQAHGLTSESVRLDAATLRDMHLLAGMVSVFDEAGREEAGHTETGQDMDLPDVAQAREEMRQQCVSYAEQLGIVFKDRHVYPQALAYFQLALKLLSGLSSRTDALRQELEIRRRCDEVHDLGPSRRVQKMNLVRIEAVAAQLEDLGDLLDASLRRAWFELRCDRHDRALEIVRRIELDGLNRHPREAQTMVYRVMAVIEHETGDFAASANHAERALHIDEAAGDRQAVLLDWVNLASAFVAQGDDARALAAAERAAALETSHTPAVTRARLLGVLGLSQLRSGSKSRSQQALAAAGESLRSALRLAQSLGDSELAYWVARVLSELYFQRGEMERAIYFAQHYYDIATHAKSAYAAATLAETLAHFYCAGQDAKRALDWAKRAAKLARAKSMWRCQLRTAMRKAQALLMLQKPQHAYVVICEAMELFQQREQRLEEERELLETYARCVHATQLDAAAYASTPIDTPTLGHPHPPQPLPAEIPA